MPDYIAITLRAAAAYFALLLMTRLMGKRQISQMTFFDFTVGITIGTIAGSMAIDSNMNPFTILPAMIVFAFFQLASSYLCLKSQAFRKIVEGEPTVLIENGKLLKNNLIKERLNVHELSGRLREKDAFSMADVEFAVLETDGQISVLKAPASSPTTPSDLGQPGQPSGLGTIVIQEGQLLADKLRQKGLTKSWLMARLGEQGINNPGDILLCQVDESGKVYVDVYE